MVQSLILASAIALEGVTGVSLCARSQFDANNVRVGDPMSLTVDFIGEADFASLHPPALSKEVDASVWKIDDAGAKTTTYLDARRLSYRVRPLKEGVLEFPALTFSFENSATGAKEEISTLPLPVHAKAGTQVALEGLDETGQSALPQPDGIFADLSSSPWGSGEKLSQDERFMWRKACNRLSAADFSKFDFPEARFNEAACEIADGNWARALKIYSSLEWRTGQTPTMERGIVAALALKNGDPAAELPVWRQVLRPVLRFGWKGRAASVLACLAAVAALMYLFRKIIKALVALAIVAAPFACDAEDIFEAMERRHRQMQEEMQKQLDMMTRAMGGSGGGSRGAMPGFSMSFNSMDVPRPEIKAFVKVDKSGVAVGEEFNFIVELEMPKSCTVSVRSFLPSRAVALVQTGKAATLTDAASTNTSNVVKRTSIPCRYDAPFSDKLVFKIEGDYMMRVTAGDGRRAMFTQQVGSNFSISSNSLWFEVKTPEGAGNVKNYKGAVGTKFSLAVASAKTRVATNDIVKVVYSLDYNGYLPDGSVDYETERRADGQSGRVLFTRYTVADGRTKTDPVSFSWYDTAGKKYREAMAEGVAITYVPEEESVTEALVVNREESREGLVPIRLAPSSSARETGLVDPKDPALRITETWRGYVRVDDGKKAGWARKEDLE